MITGVHTMFYTSEPENLRAFMRDKLGFPHTDVGEGWLIFDMPDAEMGCHPAEDVDGGRPGTPYISFYCDDIEKTVAELKSRGVEFTDEIQDVGYGVGTHFRMPGGVQVHLYQPRYTRNAKPAASGSSAANRKEAGRKAAQTKKRRKAGAKAAATRKRSKAGRKAAATRAKRR
jgi:predicted enzyme related to lactoylglutathione lyase